LEVSWKGLVEPANRRNKGEWSEIDLYGSWGWITAGASPISTECSRWYSSIFIKGNYVHQCPLLIIRMLFLFAKTSQALVKYRHDASNKITMSLRKNNDFPFPFQSKHATLCSAVDNKSNFTQPSHASRIIIQNVCERIPYAIYPW
jgi:hypothetical protein